MTTTTETESTADTVQQVARYVAAIYEPEDIVAVRAIDSSMPTGRQSIPSWHYASELPELRGLAKHNSAGRNIYVGVAARTGKGESGNKSFARCRVLLADFDGMNVDDARARIPAAGLPPPTMLVSSGHGAHAYWRLSDPIEDAAVWRRWQRSVAAMLGSDKSMDDADQMIRLPGFMNTKHKPYVPCFIVGADESRIYDLEDLGLVIPLVRDDDRKPAAPVGAKLDAGQRHPTLISLAGTMRRRGMEVDEIEAALQAVNENRCEPPLDRDEVRRIAECAAKYPAAAPIGASTGGYDDAPTEDGSQQQQDQPERFRFYTADEFNRLDLRRDYHVPGILAAGPVPTVLAGSFKTLKTSIAMDLAQSVATGSAFLRHFTVAKPCPVAMMSGESGGFALQSLAHRVAHSKGWTMDAIGAQLRICTAVPNAGKPSDLGHVEQFIDRHKIGLIFLDPAYLMMRGMRSDDAGNLFAMAQFLDPLGKVAERTGCTVCIIHHNSRGATRANVAEPAELSDIAWSGFAEWAGQWLLLSRRERFNPDSNGEHKLWLSAGGRDGHSNLVGINVTEGRSDDIGGMRWEVSVEQASRVRHEAATLVQDQREQDRLARLEKQTTQDKQAVMEIVRKLPEGDTKTGIRDRAGLRSERFNPAFAALIAEASIVPIEIKKGKGRTYEGYVIAEHRDASGRNGTERDCPGVRVNSGDRQQRDGGQF
jgi:hypothetical protein